MTQKHDEVFATSNWSRSEIVINVLFVVSVICAGSYQVYVYSTESIPLLRGLENGWMFNRKMDIFDSQWAAFRSSLPLLCLVAAVHSLCISACRSALARFRVQFMFGLVFMLVLYGYKVIYIVCLACLNFGLRFVVRRNSLVAATWIFNLGALILVSGTGEHWPMFEFLRPFAGMERWSHHFNMIVLKMISFSIDYHKMRSGDESSGKHLVANSYKFRQETPRPNSEYSLLNYLCYLLYSPLLIAGPIISFNAWQSQMISPTFSPKAIFVYAFRWLTIFLLMELFSHFNYSNAIAAQKSAALEQMPTLLLALVISVSVLFYMWLKFLLIWRFFRLWSMLVGIEAPENMNRCVLNNYSIAKFWKGWHSSFNIWIVRYIYVPLGGSGNGLPGRLGNILLVFTFVALWHDLDWRVFHWAFFVSLVFVPELVGGAIYHKSRFFKNLKMAHPQLCKHIAITAGALNVFLLMACNLVGYVFGLEGLSLVGHLVSKTANFFSVLLIGGVVYSAVSLMMFLEEYKSREAPKKRTISI